MIIIKDFHQILSPRRSHGNKLQKQRIFQQTGLDRRINYPPLFTKSLRKITKICELSGDQLNLHGMQHLCNHIVTA